MVRRSTESVLQALRAVLAKELVLGRGFSRARAARLLQVTPPAVSQYVSGKRGGPLVSEIEHDKQHMSHVQQLVHDVLAAPADRPERIGALLLKTAEKVAGRLDFSRPSTRPEPLASESLRRQSLQVLRERMDEEHHAAASCLRFAQSCEDARIAAMFRQIASDSVRHADTMALLVNYVEHPETLQSIALPAKETVAKLIEAEESADEANIGPLKARLGPAARLLIESVDADERKHVLLLRGLLTLIEEQERIHPDK